MFQDVRGLAYKKGGSKPQQKHAHKLNKYQLLGVTHSASRKEIKQAYYKKSKALHPDRNDSPDAAIKFQEVTDAYEILSNKDTRADYDFAHGFTRAKDQSFEENHEEGPPPMPSFYQHRTIYNRMRKQQPNDKRYSRQFTPEEIIRSCEQNRDSVWNQMNRDVEFFRHLSPEMQKTYDAYIKQEMELRQKQADEALKERHPSTIFGLLGAFFVLIFALDQIGQIWEVTQPHKKDDK